MSDEWDEFLDGRVPTPSIAIEFLETKPANGWGRALNFLVMDYELRISLLEERMETLSTELSELHF